MLKAIVFTTSLLLVGWAWPQEETQLTNLNVAVKLFAATDLPKPLAEQVVRRLERAAAADAPLPSDVLARLPEHRELSALEQRLAAERLVAAYIREGNMEAAAAICQRFLSFEGVPATDLLTMREAYAQVLTRQGEHQRAREEYATIMECPESPAHLRALATLELVQSWRNEGKLAEAIQAYKALEHWPDVPAHLVEEAQIGARECSAILTGKVADTTTIHHPPLLPTPAVTFFVAPNGSDANSGTKQRPFATLECARQAVRAQRIKGHLPAGGVTIFLRGGRYAVTNTFILGADDSGTVGAPVVYRAWPGERPILDGGLVLRGLKKVKEAHVLSRLPPSARGKVYRADLTRLGLTEIAPQAGFGFGIANQRVLELFQDGVPLQPARWPKNDFAQIGTLLDGTNFHFACDPVRTARWAEAGDVMAAGYWYYSWAACSVPVKIDRQAGALTLQQAPGNYGIKSEQPFYLYNLLEELASPGQWYIDRPNRAVYLWPRRHPWLGEVVLSRLDKPFIRAAGAREVALIGLTLQYGQHGGIELNNCLNCTLAACEIRALGGTALTARRCANLKVYGNRLHTLGHTGMVVEGGDRRQLIASANQIENNEVFEFGRCARTYAPALQLEGCGARVAHNHFHHAPSSAMRIEGNDHLIEYNEIDHVVLESDDQGGLDMWGDPSYRGITMRYNHWHDIGSATATHGQAGIRFDDAISGMLVYGNLFERTSTANFGGVQIHGGHYNIIDRNTFVQCRYAISFSGWGKERWARLFKSKRAPKGNGEFPIFDLEIDKKLHSTVNIDSSLYQRRYPLLSELGKRADYNSLWRNTYVAVAEPLHNLPTKCDRWANRSISMEQFQQMVLAKQLWCPAIGRAGQYPNPLRRE